MTAPTAGEGTEVATFQPSWMAVTAISPTTPGPRRAAICEVARGFVYVVSDVGTTGERDELPPALSELVAAVRAEAAVPVAVGFGIGTPEQAAAVGAEADGVIIGSRLVRAAAEAGSGAAAADAVRSFLAEAREAMAGRGREPIASGGASD